MCLCIAWLQKVFHCMLPFTSFLFQFYFCTNLMSLYHSAHVIYLQSNTVTVKQNLE